MPRTRAALPVDDDVLLDWWRIAHLPDTRDRLVEEVPVPGDIASRCRYEAIAAGVPSHFASDAFAITSEAWHRQLDAQRRGDAALKANDRDVAEDAFDSLLASHTPRLHPAPLIDGLIGLGDAARQADDTPTAIERYGEAIAAARRAGYAFASVRARIPLGYLHLHRGSARVARDEFDLAASDARAHDWRLDRANALVGSGEASQRLREAMPALRSLLDALDIFVALKSDHGVANATMNLGDVCRREIWTEDAAGWYRQAIAAATRSRVEIALSNAHDGLGEVLLELGDLAGAREHHQAALNTAGHEYVRGRAHALGGLARCAVAEQDWEVAAAYFREAKDHYEAIHDFTSAAAAHSGLAKCARELGEVDGEIAHHLAAVASIETMRGVQQRQTHQGEYFDRFAPYYSSALRAAVRAEDAAAFVTVFESISGRLLAGMLSEVAADTFNAQFLGQLALTADRRKKRFAAGSHSADLRDQTRRLGNLALRFALPGMASSAFDDVVARLHTPFDVSAATDLWNDAEAHESPLLLATLLRDKGQFAWLVRTTDGHLEFGLSDLPDETLDLIATLHRDGLAPDAVPEDVAALAPLLPPELMSLFAPGERISIVPADRLWAVPWGAIPLPSGEFLVECHPFSVYPSLTVLARSPGRRRAREGKEVAIWRSPAVRDHRVVAFEDSSSVTQRVMPSAVAASAAILDHDADTVVIVAHGRPGGGLLHVIDLDDEIAVTPADLLKADPPHTLALISCWGVHAPGRVSGDPLTVATLALARGTRAILATTSELLDDAASSDFVNMVLHGMIDDDAPTALHRAAKRWLDRTDLRGGYLSRWAPLVAVGCW
jgi:tetratricopeptide (TPR) repeat protein